MLNFPRWKVVMIVGFVLFGILTALPNFLSEKQVASLPGFMPSDTLSLGLDLKGGVYLLFEAKTEDIISARMKNLATQIRDISSTEGRRRDNERSERVRFDNVTVNGHSVTFKLRDIAHEQKALDLLEPVTQAQVGAGITGVGVTEIELEQVGDQFVLTLTEPGIVRLQRGAISTSIEVIRRRVDPDGVKEISLKPSGDNRIILEVPGANDTQEIIDLVGKTARLSFHDVVTTLSPREIQAGPLRPRQLRKVLKRGGYIVIKEREIVSGDDLTDARPSFDDQGQPAVSFVFNSRGARRFGDHTRKNIGRPFAILLDDIVISAPRIVSPILTGSGQITNMGSVADATELATLLKSGALPVELFVKAQKTVGPDMVFDSFPLIITQNCSAHGFPPRKDCRIPMDYRYMLNLIENAP
ncbi:MAG: hypothetical protein JKY60_20060 [Kordiimonadaceae bacterium]|nr:hypothetical protein [Kordiimonadaceae bacterium]